jgi:hypothetical protein
MPNNMRAIEITEPGGPEVLKLATRPVPEPLSEQILIAVDHAGVNRPDALQRAGSYAPPPGASDLPGLEAAGTVAAVGPGVTKWQVGDSVCALLPGGGYAEYAVTHQDHALPVPTGMSMAQAAALCETFFTVWSNVFVRGGLKAGERFLVHGGSSGIGTTAIQLAARFGARVFTTAGTDREVRGLPRPWRRTGDQLSRRGFRRDVLRSADDWDELNFPRPEIQEFDRVVERAISRRGFLGGVLAFGSGAAAMGVAGLKGSTAMAAQSSRFAFEQLPAQTDNTVHVPEGYEWDVLVRWGDPLFSDAPAFDPAKGVPAAGADRVFGENTDGMELFNVGGKEILVVNSEYCNRGTNLPHTEDGTPTSLDDVRIFQNLQGVNIMEIAEGENGWEVVVDSPYNRRITHLSDMVIDGPAAGHDLLKTAADPHRDDGARHAQQLRLGPDALGHLPDLRRELQRLFRLDRRDAVRRRPRRRLQALRHRRRRLGL